MDDFGYICEKVFYSGICEEYIFYRNISKFLKKNAVRSNPFFMKIPCPICGYYLPPITQKIKTDSKDSISSYLDILSPKIAIKKIWPKRNNYTWMIGFFKNKDFFQNRRLSP